MTRHLLDVGIKLPLETVTQTLAIIAKRRVGKSYTARLLAEQLLKAGQQVVIVDPKGDHWGIRSGRDGSSPGLPVVILGGEHGDVPIEPTSGEVVAKLIAKERVSVLIDLSLFRKREVSIFMTGFLENLYRIKAREQYRTPMMLVLDEADAIAPQKPYSGQERMLGAAEDIVRRGGQRGLGCTLVTQRSAVLNKNVLTQAEMLVALRTIAPQDLKALDAWIEVHGEPEQRKTLMESLPSLPQGEAWFWSPGWPTARGIFQRVTVPMIDTFDSGATPKAGEKRVEPKNLADVDLAVLRTSMAATIERAKAEDPAHLRRRIAELEREVRKKEKAPAAAASPDDKQIARVEAMIDKLTALGDRFVNATGEAEKAMKEVHGKLRAVSSRPAPAPRPLRVSTPRPASRPREVAATATDNGRQLGGGVEQRILGALAELDAMGVPEAPRVQVAFLAGYSNIASKGFANAIGALRSADAIAYPGAGTMALTDAGRERAPSTPTPRTVQELQDRILRLLGGQHERVLRPLIDTYPDPIPRTELAAAAGYTNLASKGFANAIGRLRSLGFIDYPRARHGSRDAGALPGGLVSKPNGQVEASSPAMMRSTSWTR